MWHTKEFLRRCEALHQAGLACSFEQGDCIARGYADLGYEEFVIIAERKLISLYSGKSSELPAQHERFFFLVPSIDRFLREITARAVDVGALSFKDQRTWSVELKGSAGNTQTVEASGLEELFLNALMKVVTENADA